MDWNDPGVYPRRRKPPGASLRVDPAFEPPVPSELNLSTSRDIRRSVTSLREMSLALVLVLVLAAGLVGPGWCQRLVTPPPGCIADVARRLGWQKVNMKYEANYQGEDTCRNVVKKLLGYIYFLR